MKPLQDSLPEVFISELEVKKRVRELADQINADYGEQEITAICTLKGGVVFLQIWSVI